jgi:hypothetical protein
LPQSFGLNSLIEDLASNVESITSASFINAAQKLASMPGLDMLSPLANTPNNNSYSLPVVNVPLITPPTIDVTVSDPITEMDAMALEISSTEADPCISPLIVPFTSGSLVDDVNLPLPNTSSVISGLGQPRSPNSPTHKKIKYQLIPLEQTSSTPTDFIDPRIPAKSTSLDDYQVALVQAKRMLHRHETETCQYPITAETVLPKGPCHLCHGLRGPCKQCVIQAERRSSFCTKAKEAASDQQRLRHSNMMRSYLATMMDLASESLPSGPCRECTLVKGPCLLCTDITRN